MSRPAPWALAAALVAALWWGSCERADRLRAEGAYELLDARADSSAAAARAGAAGADSARVAAEAYRRGQAAARDSLADAAAREARRNEAARERARRAAEAATRAEDGVRVALAGDSVALAALDRYVEAVAGQIAAVEERAVAAESRGDLLAASLAAERALSASWEREAGLERAARLQIARALADREAAEAAKPDGRWLGMDPGTAYLAGVVTGVTVVAGGVVWMVLR